MTMDAGGGTGRFGAGGAGAHGGMGAYQMQNILGQQSKLKVTKLLIHPGEINSFKCWPLNRRIIASHSDHQEIFIWDMSL